MKFNNLVFHIVSALAALTLSVLIAGPAAAQRSLYGIQRATSTIVRVNPLTGATTPIANPVGLTPNHTLLGLTGAEGGAVLIYENDDDGSINNIQRYSPITGALLSTHTNDSWSTDGLSYQSGAPASIFYSHTSSDVHRQAGYDGLETFGVTGIAPIGGLGGDDLGRAFQNSADGNIREFNPANGAILNTYLAPVVATEVQGLAFDGQTLFLSTSIGTLYRLNPNTGVVLGQVTVIGGPLYGLGTALVPEPATVWLLVLGIISQVMVARRRARA